MKISEIPREYRPREKAIHLGLDALSDGELLAIIIGSGTKGKSALEIGNELLQKYQNLNLLCEENHSNLSKQKGISKVTALRISACFEIANRLKKNWQSYLKKISSPNDLYKVYSSMNDELCEHARIVFMNRLGYIIREKDIVGVYFDSVELTGKEIINEVFTSGATKVALIHNHPSGNVTPSEDDMAATESFFEILKNVGVIFYDHMIIGNNTYYSFLENGGLTFCKNKHLKL